eukprot:COSAG05_NODE_2652_length_2800_cov_2.215476_1_plen_515_part_00
MHAWLAAASRAASAEQRGRAAWCRAPDGAAVTAIAPHNTKLLVARLQQANAGRCQRTAVAMRRASACRRGAPTLLLCSLVVLAVLVQVGARRKKSKAKVNAEPSGLDNIGLPDTDLGGAPPPQCGAGMPSEECRAEHSEAAPGKQPTQQQQQQKQHPPAPPPPPPRARRRRQPQVAPVLRGPLTFYSLSKVVATVGHYAHVGADPPLPPETVSALKELADLARFNNSDFLEHARQSGWEMLVATGNGRRGSGKGEPFWFNQAIAEAQAESSDVTKSMVVDRNSKAHHRAASTWEDPFVMRRGLDALTSAYQPANPGRVEDLKRLAKVLRELGEQGTAAIAASVRQHKKDKKKRKQQQAADLERADLTPWQKEQRALKEAEQPDVTSVDPALEERAMVALLGQALALDLLAFARGAMPTTRLRRHPLPCLLQSLSAVLIMVVCLSFLPSLSPTLCVCLPHVRARMVCRRGAGARPRLRLRHRRGRRLHPPRRTGLPYPATLIVSRVLVIVTPYTP